MNEAAVDATRRNRPGETLWDTMALYESAPGLGSDEGTDGAGPVQRYRVAWPPPTLDVVAATGKRAEDAERSVRYALVDRELEWDILELFAPLHIEEEGEWIGGNGALGAAAGDLSDVTPALPVVQAYVAALQARVAVDDTAMSTDIPCRAQAGEQERRDAVAALLFDNRHQRFAAEDYMGLLDACDSTGGGDSERAHVALAIHDLVLPTLLYREESASSVADGGYMSEALADLAQQVVRAARIPLRFLCPEYIERLRQRLRLRERAGAAGAMLELHLLRAYRENETG
ncbi:hypothetical protein CDCA_CDCA08G2509 [Cyanidium caldarium]|uniref:Uncharacterized protein n=1 Tax=Cyanidium caldarium TaxID=2771 RepID=A0AAV9IW22_CYACA|nr:hypothetical protein CDCA_CDCA08G2509 [Cyanidium caldarium]